MSEFIALMLSITEGLGLWGVFILMSIESSFIPFPSEIVVPPAAYLASKGTFSLFSVIIAGILGSLVGASINYFLAFYFGRKLIYKLANRRFARYLLISEENLIKSENYIKRYGAVSTFFGRLIPAVRQLISIPAGFSKMNFLIFIFFTALGSSIWVVILALLGFYFGENQDLLNQYFLDLKWIFISSFVLILGIFILRFFIIRKNRSNGLYTRIKNIFKRD